MRTSHGLALMLLLLPSAAARGEDGVTEAWDRLHMAGAPAGYVHSTARTVAEPTPRVESTSHAVMSMKRMGQTSDIVATTETWETPDGTLLRIAATSKMSAQESRSVFTFAGGKVTIETTVMGKTRTVEKDVPAGLAGPVHAERQTRTLAGTTGKTLEFTTYMSDFQAVVRTTSTSKGAETVKLEDGTTVELTRVETKLAMVGGGAIPMSPVSWLDAKGETIKTYVNAAGVVIETYRVADEKAAKAERAAKGPTPDLFAETLIQEDGPIPVARRLDEATIVITKRRPDVTLTGLADAGHRVTEREDGTLLVHAARRTPAAQMQGERPIASPAPDLADSLAPSSTIQSDAPEIVAIVKETVGAETNAWKAAQALERWVCESVTKKNMNVAFASALEVCKSREGDCTEHAVLLAALCRAAGIPARVVMGVEYLYGIWGGHAWNEVWIEGEWFPLDATNGLGFVDPLHLPMTRMTMKEGAGAEFVQLLGGLGGIDVDVIEVVRDGRKIAVDDPALVSVEKGVWRNRLLGISFPVPAGFELDPPSRRPGIQLRVMELDGKSASGKKAEIEIEVMDAPAVLDWTKLLAEFRVDAADAKAGKVDGRESRVVSRTRDGGRIRAVVVADGALWLFELDRVENDAERAMFDEFLAGVDFDVK